MQGRTLTSRDSEGNPILFRAILKGNVSIVEILVDAEADVNARDAEGNTLLRIAVSQGNTAIVQILVDAGAR